MSRNTSLMNGMSLICGVIAAICAFISRVIFGSPLDMIHKLEGIDLLPPIWIFNFICVAWYFFIGVAAGTVINGVSKKAVCGREELWAYRGGLFFLITFFSGLIWYPVFFVAQAIFISFAVSLAVTLGSLICAYFWFGSGVTIPALIVSANTIWSFYLLIVNISVLLSV